VHIHRRAALHQRPLCLTCGTRAGCQKRFLSASSLRRHVALAHEPSRLKHKCAAPGCGRAFFYGRELVSHTAKHHKDTTTVAAVAANADVTPDASAS
jgi:hypothetical protein